MSTVKLDPAKGIQLPKMSSPIININEELLNVIFTIKPEQ